MTDAKAGIIYSARCIRCARIFHRVGEPVRDGERIPHAGIFDDDQGLTNSFKCDAPFVSLMGRTSKEIADAAERIRKEAAR